MLDHHVSGDDLGAELFKDADAEATGRLVVEAADQLGVPLTPRDRRARLRRPDDRHRLVPFLARPRPTRCGWPRGWSRPGAAPDQLYKELYENDSHARLQLIGRALARAQTELDGRLIYTWLDQADFAATGALPSDSEDIINMTLSVGGTQAAVILVEQPDGRLQDQLAQPLRGGLQPARRAVRRRRTQESRRRVPQRTARLGQRKVLDAVRAAMK